MTEPDVGRGLHEGGVPLVSAVDLDALFAQTEAFAAAGKVFGPDFYHLNFANDGPLPVARILSDDRIDEITLKFSQGTSYGDWAVHQAAAVRASRATLGGYHMLSGSDGSGAEQAHYFLSKYRPQPGDLAPAMDFEASGRGGASISAYAAKAKDFTAAIHAAGFEVIIYGHADVKAAWSDWRSSGADYWWVPGDSPHNDVGPRGPDLWQYGPFTAPAGYPTDPLGSGQRADMSVVLTALPLIGGGEPDMTPAEVKQLIQDWWSQADGPKARLDRVAQMADDAGQYIAGVNEYQAGHPLDPDPTHPWPAPKKQGWTDARFAATHPTVPAGGASKTHVHTEGVTGPPKEPAP